MKLQREPHRYKGVSQRFFARSTQEVARALLGCILLHQTKEGVTSGIIVETEAYLQNDPANHAFRGMTQRNAAMFGPAGHAYVYFTYGMHYCFNVVTNREGIGEAVLIRALEPLEGIEMMKKRRGIKDVHQLCNGPAKLVQALGITKAHNGCSLLRGELRIMVPKKKKSFEIAQTTRIGVANAAHLPLRFFVKGSQWVSRAVPSSLFTHSSFVGHGTRASR